MALSETGARLVKLDCLGVAVWRNNKGWFWASRDAQRQAVAVNGPNPAHGPFRTADAVACDAYKRLGL